MLVLITALTLAAQTAGPADVEILFAPQIGSIATKHFERTVELRLEEAHSPLDGFNIYEATRTETRTHVFEDEILAPVEAGRPERLRRRFLRVHTLEHEDWAVSRDSRRTWQTKRSRREGESRLQDRALLFDWDELDESFTTGFDEERPLQDGLLVGVNEDTDLRDFLPGARTSPGKEWRADSRAFRRLFEFGGTLPCEQESGEQLTGTIDASWIDSLRGDIRVRFARVDEVHGVALAELELRGYLDGEQIDDEEADSPECRWTGLNHIRRSTELHVFVEGRILWDLEAQRLHSADVQGDLELVRRFVFTGDDGRDGIDAREDWEGEFSCTLTVE